MTVEDEVVGAVGRGLLAYLAAGEGDTDDDVQAMVQKIAGLRIFPDDQGKMARSVEDVGGAILVVSQFTLYGDVRRGRRPSFDGAARPETARLLYHAVQRGLEARGLEVASGRFQASMRVHSEGDGPVTILIDSRKAF